MADWSFLTNYARVLLCIAHDPGVRLRDLAARTGITERTAYGIVDTPGSPVRPLPSGVSRSTSGTIDTSSTSPRSLSRASDPGRPGPAGARQPRGIPPGQGGQPRRATGRQHPVPRHRGPPA